MVTQKADSFMQTDAVGTCLYGIQSMPRGYFRGCGLFGSPDTENGCGFRELRCCTFRGTRATYKRKTRATRHQHPSVEV